MNTKFLQVIALKIRNKYPQSVIEQCQHIPKMLVHSEQQYVLRQLKTSAYYKEKKQEQLREREKVFFDVFTINNPYRSKNLRLANKKERELLRAVIYQHVKKDRILKLLQYFVIPCSRLSSYELRLLTDSLLISCIDPRLRKYVKVSATKLGSNRFAEFLIKENWKRESPNHLVWKFELKRTFGFFIEQKVNKYHRVDLLKKHKGKMVIGEIVCTRQSINSAFQAKIRELLREFERANIVLLAPTRLHAKLQHLCEERVTLVNAKTVLPYLKRLFARKERAETA